MGVSRTRLATQLTRATRVCLDSVILIYHLEEVEPYADLTEEIVAQIAAGRLEAVVSTVTVTELLVKPFAEGQADRVAAFETFLHSLQRHDYRHRGEEHGEVEGYTTAPSHRRF